MERYDAQDLIDHVLDKCVCVDCMTDSPYVDISNKDRESLVVFFMKNYETKMDAVNGSEDEE